MYVLPDVLIPYPPSHLFYALDLYIDWSFCDIIIVPTGEGRSLMLCNSCALVRKSVTEEGTGRVGRCY